MLNDSQRNGSGEVVSLHILEDWEACSWILAATSTLMTFEGESI